MFDALIMNTPRTNSVPSLTAVILAGGEGARFAGADKGLLRFQGRPLIERMLSQQGLQASSYLISANRNFEKYRRYGHPVVADREEGYTGPMAGIASTLSVARTEWVLFAPVDAVQLPSDYAQRMCASAHQNGSSTVVVHDGVSIIPVACLIKRTLHTDLDANFTSGQRSMRDWLRRQRAFELHFDDHPRAYWSANTPEELEAFERQLKS